jgi:hypothetical protein
MDFSRKALPSGIAPGQFADVIAEQPLSVGAARAPSRANKGMAAMIS